ncbi:MAG: rhodanese-like domain-containing protein, partial [Pseudomonadota bacterium]|nr:rhodanese-like domain-containing protein [Pseudomonadota bacterium]
LSVLDGGLKAWQKVGGKIEIQPNTLEPSTYQVSIQPKKFASKFKTLMATKQENTLIVDARPEQEYQGLESRTDQFGHIPTAINLPWKQLVEPSDKPPTEESYFRYKTLNKLQEQFEIIPENKKIILYCNGGRESSVLYFGLKLLGREAALYDGSWFEWSSDKSLPKTSPVKRGQNESH